MQIALQNAHEGLLELLIGEGVAERVDGAVSVTKKIGKHVDVGVGAMAEALSDGQYVVRRPTSHEGPPANVDGP